MVDLLFVIPSLIVTIGVTFDVVTTYIFLRYTKLSEGNKIMRRLLEKRLFYPFQIGTIVSCWTVLYFWNTWYFDIIFIGIGLYRFFWGGIRNIVMIRACKHIK